MSSSIELGAASAAPTFNPAAWTIAWAAIGGGYARTAAGLFLSWETVTDAETRSRLHQQIASTAATRRPIEYLDARQAGESVA